MKLLSSLIFALSLAGCSLMDNDIPASKVPSVVKNAFDQAYVNALDVEWEKEKGNYEVSFDLGNVDHKALYSPEGKLMMTKKDILLSELPVAITDKIAVDYPDHKVDDVEKVETNETILYQVELDGPIRDKKLVYTTEGQESKDFQYWD